MRCRDINQNPVIAESMIPGSCERDIHTVSLLKEKDLLMSGAQWNGDDTVVSIVTRRRVCTPQGDKYMYL